MPIAITPIPKGKGLFCSYHPHFVGEPVHYVEGIGGGRRAEGVIERKLTREEFHERIPPEELPRTNHAYFLAKFCLTETTPGYTVDDEAQYWECSMGPISPEGAPVQI